MKKLKRYLAIILALTMVLSSVTVASAATIIGFPLRSGAGDLVADKDTRYVTLLTQDAETKLITATVQVQNNGAEGLVINGIGLELSFSDQVAPYSKGDGEFVGEADQTTEKFANYCDILFDGFTSVSSTIISNDSAYRMISANIAATKAEKALKVGPGAVEEVAKFYFMPVNQDDDLDMEMFSYQYVKKSLRKYGPFLGNGTKFLTSNDEFRTSIEDVCVVSPEAFKVHVQHLAPVVTADNEQRSIQGYDSDTMEWSEAESGPYQSGEPVIGNEAKTVFVRVKGDIAYSESNGEFQNYKMYVASKAVEVVFDEGVSSTDIHASKVSENITHTDGTTHVGDTIRYTITASNDGDSTSIWKDVVVTDELPDGVTLVKGSVTVNGVEFDGGYDEATRTLTIPLGDVAGQEETELVFVVTVDADAHGKNITNSAVVSGKDGEDGTEIEKNVTEEESRQVADESKSSSPTIEEVVEGDRTVSGTGVPGAEVEVSFPGGDKITVEVDENGNWTVDVPTGVDLKENDKVSAVQTETGKDPSPSVEVIVKGKEVNGKPEPVAEKSSENLSRKDGKNYIGDVLKYTIKVGNEGTGDWNNVVITDVLPDGLTMSKGVQINGSATSDYTFDSATRTLSISLGTIPADAEKLVTFKAIIDADARIESNIKNSAKISGTDVDDKEVNIDVEEPGDGREIEKPEEKEDGFFAVKTSRNTTSKNEKTYIGDIIEYIIAIGNNTEVKEVEEHIITYKANDGTDNDHIVVVAGENYVILDNDGEEIDFTREGFEFSEWNTAQDGSGVSYKAGDTIIVTEDITLYAQWNIAGTDPEEDESELNTAEPEAPATEGTTGGETATEEESDQEAVVEEESGEEAVTEETSDKEAVEPESEDQAGAEEASDSTDSTSEDVQTNDDATTESNDSDVNQSKEAMLSMLRSPMFSIGSTRALNDNGNASIIRILGKAGTSSYWYQTSITDKLPEFVTFVEGSVKIDGQKTDQYVFENGILTVNIGDIPAGEMVIVTFDVTIDDDAAGKTIKNVATVSGQDEDGENIDKPAEESGGGREVEENKDLFTVTYKAGSGTGSDIIAKVKAGTDHKAPTATGMSKEGYSFASWNTVEDGSGKTYKANETVPVTGDITLYAQWSKDSTGPTGGGGGGGGTTIKDEKTPLGLNKEDHIAYVKGYPEGDFRPEKSITRAEAAQLFYNLLVGVKKTGYSTQFGDVNAGAWYADAVNCLSANNIIQGYPDGSFKPNNYITRAEFATLSSKFDKLSASDSNRFNDVNDSHWAVSYINSAAVKGWIKGYENGEFRPAKNITRAEVVTLVNAILERKVSASDILSNAKTFNDLATSHWAYCDIIEAANEHTYSRKEDKIHETWIEVIR